MILTDKDPFACEWLQGLVASGALAPALVLEADVAELQPVDVEPTTHFFAGIGGWPYALQLAGWPPDRPVWTASLPCQPFSQAGHQRGIHDDRHLWPTFARLVAECRPPTIFGEQVASPAGRAWLAAVRVDLEALGYAVGAADLCAASVGAPHRRQRLFWVAHAHELGREGLEASGLRHQREPGSVAPRRGPVLGGRGGAGDLGDRAVPSGARGAWGECAWVACSDGGHRPIEPGVRALADGVPRRVELLRAYGNAIVPQVAAAFVEAFVEARRF